MDLFAGAFEYCGYSRTWPIGVLLGCVLGVQVVDRILRWLRVLR